MASCVKNICTKNYKNLIIGFQVKVENVGDAFLITRLIVQEILMINKILIVKLSISHVTKNA